MRKRKKKKNMFSKGFYLLVKFLILGCLNTEFRKLSLTAFNFQIILFNDTFVNILKTIGFID